VTPGEGVPEGGHCIWECGAATSVHTCSDGQFQPAPPPGCYCPALPGDQVRMQSIYPRIAPQGELLCVPPLLDSGEGREGTYCIFSCGDHPLLDIACAGGVWDTDPEELTCSR
jgi:hypothetical protein